MSTSQSKRESYEEVLDHLQKELSSFRTGRANPQMMDEIAVAAYGSTMALKGVASVGVLDAKTLSVEPWDKSLLQAVEKAIRDADLGVSPSVDGSVIRVNFPSMTEETRMKLVKAMREKLEEARVSLRQLREKAREEAIKAEREKKMSEDEKYKLLEELDKMTKEYVAQADAMGAKKEEEVMKV